MQQIAGWELAYQEELNRGFARLSEGSFKGLRRQLPITRQKVEWEKVGGYRVRFLPIPCGSFFIPRDLIADYLFPPAFLPGNFFGVGRNLDHELTRFFFSFKYIVRPRYRRRTNSMKNLFLGTGVKGGLFVRTMMIGGPAFTSQLITRTQMHPTHPPPHLATDKPSCPLLLHTYGYIQCVSIHAQQLTPSSSSIHLFLLLHSKPTDQTVFQGLTSCLFLLL